MFEELLAGIISGIPAAGAIVDKAVTDFRADQNNVAKAKTVAQGLLSLIDLIAAVKAAIPPK